MTSLRFTTSNIASFSNDAPAYLIGKNGFSTELGTIPLLVTAVSREDAASKVQFVVRGLNDVYDDNSLTHVLNNNTFPGPKQVSYKVLHNSSDVNSQQIGYVDPFIFTSSNVSEFYTTNNTIKIVNSYVDNVDLYSRLETVPFYIKIHQPLATNNYPTSKSMYISGTTLNVAKYYTVEVFGNASYIADLGLIPESKNFVSVFVDGVQQNQSFFSWDNLSNITIPPVPETYSNLRITYSKYTVPTVEIGDNVFVVFNNTYSISNTSYAIGTPKYNSILATNNIFKIYTSDNLKSNFTSFIATNISPNPIGTIGNVYESTNTFSLDYNNATYPGSFNLSNNYVYKLVKGRRYTALQLLEGRTLYNVPRGSISVRARNTNSTGRRSHYATQTAIIEGLTLPAVRNLTVRESLYRDATQGIATRAVVTFEHDSSRDILSYEVSYKIQYETTTNDDLGDFITVQIPASGATFNDDVDVVGTMRYTINNIERGTNPGSNSLVVKVTPINNDLSGITRQIVHPIIGKTALPASLQTFNIAQNGNLLTMFWSFLMADDNINLYDLDLQQVRIRRAIGTVSDQSAWETATPIEDVSIPSTTYVADIDVYGTYTYMVKTIDTSGNVSANALFYTIVLQRPTNLSAYKTWSEDDPSANNSIVGLTNENYSEYYWPSYANSDNGGLNYAVDDPVTAGVGPSTLTENANGVSSGFSAASGITDLFVSSTGWYQTAVRDMGQIVTGKLTLNLNVYPVLSSNWLSMRENLMSGVSDGGADPKLLRDAGSGLGTYLLNYGADWDYNNQTLVSADGNNVYAIWNYGQFPNDTSNANSFALIFYVYDADTISLGKFFYAGGVPAAIPPPYFTNVTQSISSYKLVNLKQWNDAEGTGNWLGPDNLINYNVELRYSTDNVYFQAAPNANVKISNFTSNSQGLFQVYNSGDISFRWFQFRINILNDNPDLASAVFDKLRYTADLTDRTYSRAVVVNTNPTVVDISAIGFRTTPIVTLQPVIDSAIRINNTFPSYTSIGSNATQSTITVYTNTGAFVSDVTVNYQATGF